VEQALAELLAEAEAGSCCWLRSRKRRRGVPPDNARPTEQANQYLRETRSRFTLTWKLNVEAIAEAEREDGVFPLLTNDRELSATEVLQAYKRQPLLGKAVLAIQD